MRTEGHCPILREAASRVRPRRTLGRSGRTATGPVGSGTMTGTVDASTPPASSSGADTRGGAGTWVPAAGTPAGSDACGGSVWGTSPAAGFAVPDQCSAPDVSAGVPVGVGVPVVVGVLVSGGVPASADPVVRRVAKVVALALVRTHVQPRRRSESWRESRRRSARERSRRRAWPPHPSVSRLRLRHRSQRPSPAGRSRLSSPGRPAPARQARGRGPRRHPPVPADLRAGSWAAAVAGGEQDRAHATGSQADSTCVPSAPMTVTRPVASWTSWAPGAEPGRGAAGATRASAAVGVHRDGCRRGHPRTRGTDRDSRKSRQDAMGAEATPVDARPSGRSACSARAASRPAMGSSPAG